MSFMGAKSTLNAAGSAGAKKHFTKMAVSGDLAISTDTSRISNRGKLKALYKSIVMNRPKLLIVSILIAALCLVWYIHSHAEPTFYSCTQAKAAGYHDIKRGSSLYRLDLDRDHDGVACEL